MGKRYVIHLKDALNQSGLTAYAVAKRLGLNKNTVNKYLKQDVVAEYLPAHVLDIAGFLGLDWRDPDVIEVIEVEDGGESPENEAALALVS
jgi:transcriptional regulator with XRE-family HTH domain